MAYVDWKMRTVKLSACSCDYGCPCEFNAPPTRAPCEGFEASEITEGHFGEVRLDGLRFAAAFHFPGPVHEGGGVFQGIVDERADEAQREAIVKIISGEEQEPTTAFNIYGAAIAEEKELLDLPIDLAWDWDARSGRIAIPGVGEARFEPIRNPVTGKPHHAMIRLYQGFEFRDAEMASGSVKTTNGVKIEFTDRYAFLIDVTYGPYGIID